MEPDQVREFGYRVLQEFKIREHEFFADFCQTYLLDHSDDYAAVCRFLDELAMAREALPPLGLETVAGPRGSKECLGILWSDGASAGTIV